MRHFIYALLLLQLSFSAAAAGSATELQNLYNALNMLNQQQQAIYQQFQMVREVRLSNASRFYGMPMLTPPSGEIPNYDEMVEAQKNAIRRADVLEQQADQLLARYNEIEAMKKPLQQRIYDLSLKK
jgi:hypothetical protein